MSYTVAIENFIETYSELEPIYREHYSELVARQSACGIEMPPYRPRLDEYRKAASAGYLLHFVARLDGEAVGYANCYITSDMHNSELIGMEDAVFVTSKHRKGVGRMLMNAGLAELKRRGAKHAFVSVTTDPRVALLWKRMGFKETAIQMTYTF